MERPSETYRIEKNTLLLAGIEVTGQGFGFLVSLLVARILGVESYGLLAFAYGISLICLVIPGFGFGQLIVRDVARKPRRAGRYLTSISILLWVFTLPMGLLCALATYLSGTGIGRLLVVITVFAFLSATQHIILLCTFFRALNMVGKEALVRFLLALFWFATGATLLLSGFKLLPVVFSRLIVVLCFLWFTFFLLKRSLRISLGEFRVRYARAFAKTGAPLAVFNIMAMVFSSIVTVTIGFVAGDAQTAYYNAPDKIIGLFFVIPMSLSWAALGTLSVEWQKEQALFNVTYEKLIRYMILLSIPLSVFLFFSGERLVGIVYGTNYLPAAPVMKLLALALLPLFLNQVNSAALIAMNRQNLAVRCLGLGLVIEVASSILLVPLLGAAGGAISRSLALFLLLMLEVSILRRHLLSRGVVVSLLRSLFSAGVMIIGVFTVERLSDSLFTGVLAGGLSYGASLLLIGEVKAREVQGLVKGILRRTPPPDSPGNSYTPRER